MSKKVIINTTEYYKINIRNSYPYYFNTEFILNFMTKYPQDNFNDIYDDYIFKITDFTKDDVPVNIIRNWRFNIYLINYIQSLQEQNIFNGNSRDSNYKIIELDDDDSKLFDEVEIINSIERQDYYGNEVIKFVNLHKYIIKELCEMIANQMSEEDIKKYIDLNKISKYTKNVLLNKKYDYDVDDYYEYY